MLHACIMSCFYLASCLVYSVELLITSILLMFLNTGEHTCKYAPRFEGCSALAGFFLSNPLSWLESFMKMTCSHCFILYTYQVHTLLKGLEKIAASADIPMLVCGDFNSVPGRCFGSSHYYVAF